MDGGPFFTSFLLLSSFVATLRVANLLHKIKNFGRVATDRRRGNDRHFPQCQEPLGVSFFFILFFLFFLFFLPPQKMEKHEKPKKNQKKTSQKSKIKNRRKDKNLQEVPSETVQKKKNCLRHVTRNRGHKKNT